MMKKDKWAFLFCMVASWLTGFMLTNGKSLYASIMVGTTFFLLIQLSVALWNVVGILEMKKETIFVRQQKEQKARK